MLRIFKDFKFWIMALCEHTKQMSSQKILRKHILLVLSTVMRGVI